MHTHGYTHESQRTTHNVRVRTATSAGVIFPSLSISRRVKIESENTLRSCHKMCKYVCDIYASTYICIYIHMHLHTYAYIYVPTDMNRNLDRVVYFTTLLLYRKYVCMHLCSYAYMYVPTVYRN